MEFEEEIKNLKKELFGFQQNTFYPTTNKLKEDVKKLSSSLSTLKFEVGGLQRTVAEKKHAEIHKVETKKKSFLDWFSRR